MNALQQLLKDLYTISGLNISLFDIDENLITSYPKENSPFCKLIKECPQSSHICKKCDHQAFEYVKKTKTLYIYNCDFHLYEAVVPLYNYGIHTGYLMMGQTLTHSLFEKDLIKQTALPYIKNSQSLDHAINQITYHTKEQIQAYANIINIYGQYLTLSHRIEAKNKNLALEIKNYIHTHYQHTITIDILCDYFYCSRGTLTSQFKKQYHTTIHEYITNYRLQQAKHRLLTTKDTIQEISYQCGFKNPQHFCKLFKKRYSLTPREYHSQNNI